MSYKVGMKKQWSEEELGASVRAYLDMSAKQAEGAKFNKKAVYRALAESFNRSEKYVEYRMQNISHVLSMMGRAWVSGLKPAKNVGNEIASVIERQIHFIEGRDPSQEALVFVGKTVVREFDRQDDGVLKWVAPSGVDTGDLGFTEHDFAEYDRQVACEGRNNEKPKAPIGALKPNGTAVVRIEYARDQAVVSWVLGRSKGRCECCEEPAPFKKPDGTAFLEVHHLRQLANKGTDRVSNAVGVCPNCHRELHFGVEAEQLKAGMYLRIPELIRE